MKWSSCPDSNRSVQSHQRSWKHVWEPNSRTIVRVNEGTIFSLWTNPPNTRKYALLSLCWFLSWRSCDELWHMPWCFRFCNFNVFKPQNFKENYWKSTKLQLALVHFKGLKCGKHPEWRQTLHDFIRCAKSAVQKHHRTSSQLSVSAPLTGRSGWPRSPRRILPGVFPSHCCQALAHRGSSDCLGFTLQHKAHCCGLALYKWTVSRLHSSTFNCWMSCVKQYVRTRRTFQIHTQSWTFLPQLEYEDLKTPAVCQRAADSAQMSEKYQTSVFHSFKSYSSAAGERDGELSITSQHLFAIWAGFFSLELISRTRAL